MKKMMMIVVAPVGANARRMRLGDVASEVPPMPPLGHDDPGSAGPAIPRCEEEKGNLRWGSLLLIFCDKTSLHWRGGEWGGEALGGTDVDVVDR